MELNLTYDLMTTVYVLTESDIKSELKKINYKLKPLDIVFVNTSAGEYYGQR